ncbi:MAG TPA: DUF4331 domain-containing protein [Mycobacteriales bacterium]|nr:DUF4331 domain-containing protein [Mycobacteriales bacterium]
MSSHREAPQISKDPTADSTDLYAFVSPDKPSTVTLIANYIPLQAPDGGPNFYEFADDVRYAIHVDNDGDGSADISFHFRFKTVNNIPSSFLYNHGPITPFTRPGTKGTNWNRQQTYTLTRVDHLHNGRTRSTTLGKDLLVPPCNIGPLSTPNYAATYLASHGNSALQTFKAGGHTGTVFAGQRAEGFYVDLGAVFDLGGLRGFENFHVGGPAAGLMAGMPGVNSTAAVNVHSLALQVPIADLVAGGKRPSSTTSSNAVIGVWTSASRQKVQIQDPHGSAGHAASGPFVQVSRLGNPLVNELLIGLGDKDRWNLERPTADGDTFFEYFAHPLLGELLPALYTANGTAGGPTIFPHLAAYNASHTGTTKAHPARPDLIAILLSGIPNSVTAALGAPPTNVGGKALADQLRLNVAQRPTTDHKKISNLGYLGGDPAGFPNGRRVFDDVATIELRAVAGATLPLVDPTFTPDAPAGAVDFSITSGPRDTTAKGTEGYLPSFPYLGTPYSGYSTPSKTPVGSTH